MSTDKTPWNPSKKATERVKYKIEAPSACPFCDSNVEIKHHSDVYGKTFGDWPWLYKCTNAQCNSYVGMHPFTNIPLGTLADSLTRDARKKSKTLFQSLWMGKKTISRNEAYEWLASELGIPKSECHFGWFDVERCKQVSEICKKEILKKYRVK